jgi:hypothetical protein
MHAERAIERRAIHRLGVQRALKARPDDGERAGLAGKEKKIATGEDGIVRRLGHEELRMK